jgi:hypothetical protein
MQNHRVGLCLAMNMVTRDQSKVTGAPRQAPGRIIVPTPCTHPKLPQPGKQLINSRAHMHALCMVMHPKDPKRAHGHHPASLDQPHTLATPQVTYRRCSVWPCTDLYKLYRGTKFRPPLYNLYRCAQGHTEPGGTLRVLPGRYWQACFPAGAALSVHTAPRQAQCGLSHIYINYTECNYVPPLCHHGWSDCAGAWNSKQAAACAAP